MFFKPGVPTSPRILKKEPSSSSFMDAEDGLAKAFAGRALVKHHDDSSQQMSVSSKLGPPAKGTGLNGSARSAVGLGSGKKRRSLDPYSGELQPEPSALPCTYDPDLAGTSPNMGCSTLLSPLRNPP